MYDVLIGQNEMFVMEIRFKFQVVIIYKENIETNALQNIRQTDAQRNCTRKALQKIG